MAGTTFEFMDVWRVPAPTGAVVDVLADIERYPRWWPQVRAVTRIDEASGRGVVHSALPITLHLVLTRELEDREGGVLLVRLAGDLYGWARWTVRADGDGSLARFDQHVRVATRLERMATLMPWVLRANHAWMMRQGHRGVVGELVSPRR